MQPYDQFEKVMFIFREISIWIVYIAYITFSTKTTFRDELLIIRYSADENVYENGIST